MFSQLLEVASQLASKGLLTAALLFIIMLCGVEIYRLWFDHTLILTPFEYLRDGVSVREAGQVFTQLLDENLNRLRGIYSPTRSAEPAGDDNPMSTNADAVAKPERLLPSADQAGIPEEIALPVLQESILSSVEIQAYGIHLSTVLRKMTQWIWQPYQIVGSISEHSKLLHVYAKMENAPTATKAKIGRGYWHMPHENDVNDASFSLACRIFRLLLASQSFLYENVSDADFCSFNRALESYQRHRELAAERAGGPGSTRDSI